MFGLARLAGRSALLLGSAGRMLEAWSPPRSTLGEVGGFFHGFSLISGLAGLARFGLVSLLCWNGGLFQRTPTRSTRRRGRRIFHEETVPKMA